ncbi:hypothetical protein [uncultured Ruegeria sp.]|uniref:hypothetical protein n=1 Tax=uncultured Ruegeria sp. TaxID=259304 RepID=UPI00261FE3B1|nr:hypothetical protein [uncultured Ruegeria sp.]
MSDLFWLSDEQMARLEPNRECFKEDGFTLQPPSFERTPRTAQIRVRTHSNFMNEIKNMNAAL